MQNIIFSRFYVVFKLKINHFFRIKNFDVEIVLDFILLGTNLIFGSDTSRTV